MEDELARLRRLYEEEKRLREEEQGRRAEAEALAQKAQPQALTQYLESCHSLHLSFKIVTDISLSTKGEPTNPSNRLFPRRIIPWGDAFVAQQKAIWDQLGGSLFSTQAVYPSQHNLDFVKSYLDPLSSEDGLRYLERDVVENPVRTLVDQVYKDPVLRNVLGLQGTVHYESHTNLEPPPEERETGEQKPQRRARGKGNHVDQYCIYRRAGSGHAPVLAIEYKAPHKLTTNELVTGLGSELRPEHDIINKHEDNFTFAAKYLSAAIVTQLFSYMIGKSIQYGYVCTGEAFIFLHIPDDDPTVVYFSLCIPHLDVADDDEERLHRTAVAQAFAFVLKAISVNPPPASWNDQTAYLDIWPVEYDDVLKDIPETIRKEPRVTPYKPQHWKGFKRSPIQTRGRCKSPGSNTTERDDDTSEESPPSPSPRQASRSDKSQALLHHQPTSGKSPGNTGSKEGRRSAGSKGRVIDSRPFCTHKCLLGLKNGHSMDESCPNSNLHGSKHINQQEFQSLIREQLSHDRGPDADCTPLYVSGALGSLFKVCLSSHGYTVAAKGMESFDLDRLQHENMIYDRLQSLQGKFVPVCLGLIDLVLPYYYDCGVFTHFMFLSWGGLPLARCINDVENKPEIVSTVSSGYGEMHKLGVLHNDPEPRNILYDKSTGTLMIVDFERSDLDGREALEPISSNRADRKRKRVPLGSGEDVFTREVDSIISTLLRMG